MPFSDKQCLTRPFCLYTLTDRVCDLNRELEDRGIDLPKFATKAWKMKMLDDLTHEEETKELLSIAEAVRCTINMPFP